MTRPAQTDLEAFLARIYVDAGARACFLQDPRAAAQQAGLTAQDVLALASIDRVGLELAARSYAHKRRAARELGWLARLLRSG